ncbi:MAG: hypothetical protein ACJAYG_001914 [Oceanicoccus sp.]|jgi:hypothetical protein
MKLLKPLTLLSIMFLLFACASSPDITVDYSPDFQSKDVSSYYLAVGTDNGNLSDQRIISALNTQLESRGLVAKPKDQAEIWINYHVVTEDRTKVTSYNSMNSYGGYGHGYGSFYGGGWGTSPEVRVRQYTNGTLLVDLIDPKTNKTVWRGTGTANVSSKRTSEEKVVLVDSYVAAIVEKMYQQPKSK